jgi:hypothetical protein
VWLLIAVAVVGLGLLVYLLLRRRRLLAQARATWLERAAKASDDATTVRGLLDAAATDHVDADRMEALRHQTDAAAAALAQLSTTAPDDESRQRTAQADQALRGYMLAIEAEQLVPTESEDARADANVTRRARATDLDQALAQLDQLVHPPVESPPPPAS